MFSLSFIHQVLRVNTSYHTPRFLCSTASPSPAPLYLVSTPIGNPLDITLRAQKILSTVDTVAAEDTRNARQLLKSLQTPPQQSVISCHEHNWASRIPTLLARLTAGRSVALVSDAGTPCVSDPGSELVRAAVDAGVDVVPVPGPCAAVAALVASGMPVAHFEFVGFLPRTGQARRSILERIGNASYTVILYEAPHRIIATLRELATVEGSGRAVCLAREVTKRWEQFLRFESLHEAATFYETGKAEPRGEYTIVLAPAILTPTNRDDITTYSSELDIAALVEGLVKDGVPVSTIARRVASASRVPKKVVYAYASGVKNTMKPADEDCPA